MEGDSIEDVLEDHIQDVFEKKTKLPLNFYVLDVLKFIHDRYSSHLSGKDPTNEGYDLLLTDSKGKCLSKVLLGASDCLLAQKQILVPGCEIIIKSLSWQSNIHDSGIRGSHILPVTERIELLAPREDGNPPPQFDAVRSMSRYKEYQEHPLFSCRKYYISHWSSIDPPIQWVCTYPQETVPSREDLIRNAIPLSDVVEGMSSAAVTFYGSVIGRVLNKSNIIHFAKPSDQYASPYPFQFYVELSDGTQSVPVVFWNGNCLQWYPKVNVGDVLLLSRFTVKEVSDSKAQTYNRLAQLRHPTQSKQVDINLNCDRSPLAVVHVLPIDQLPPGVTLPEVSVTVNTVAKVMAISEPLLGSVGGVICHVGRLERCHHMPPPPGSLPGRPPPPQERAMLPFQQCRWVSLLDPSHPSPLLVLVSSCSQPDVFSQLQTGSVLVVTNANIWVLNSTKMAYASSSLESTLYLVDKELPPFLCDHAEDLLGWRSTSACTEKLKAYSSELVQVTPPTTPNSLSQLQLLLYQPDTNIEVISRDDDLHHLLRSLHHHQHKLLTVTASIMSVQVFGDDHQEESDLVDSAYQTQTTEEHYLQSVVNDALQERVKGHPTEEGVVGPFHVSEYAVWCMTLLTESGRSLVNVQFSPLPLDHWLNSRSYAAPSPDPVRALLGSGRFVLKDTTENLSAARRSLFQTPYSCLLSAYSLGGSFDVQITLLRAFPLL